MAEERFETEKYKFLFAEIKNIVAVWIMSNIGVDLNKNDEREINAFFVDMGKWETLERVGLNLVHDLGLAEIEEETLKKYDREFGRGKYEFKIDPKKTRHDRIVGYFSLSREERLRRSGGVSGASMKLPLEEIVSQVRNINKWRAFQKAIRLILSTKE